mgnify:CR=1 FL=1
MSMEQKENGEVLEQTEVEYPRDPHELTEEEKKEILSVFAETNENKRRRTGFKLTIKNQIILVGVVLAVAALLLGSYFLFLKEEAPLPPFYVLDEQTVTVLDALDEFVCFFHDGQVSSKVSVINFMEAQAFQCGYHLSGDR